MTYIPYGYGQPPGYLTYNNPYTQMLMNPPKQQQQGGMPSMPTGLIDKFTGGNGSPFGGLFGGGQLGAGAGGAEGFGYTGALGDTAIDGTYLGGSTSGAGGASGMMGSLGPIAAIMAAVAGTKELERAQGNSTTGKIWGSFNAPSFNQIKADPKLGFTTALGVPFVNGFIRNDKAAEAEPEWQPLLNGIFGRR